MKHLAWLSTLAAPLPLAGVLLLGVATPAAPQVDTLPARIQGVLLDERTWEPVYLALVRLLDTEGQTVASVESDRQGRFSLQVPALLEIHFRVERLGYQIKESGSFIPPPGYQMTVQIRLSPDPLPLDSVQVAGRRRPLRATEQLLLGQLLDYESGAPVAQGTVSLFKAYGMGADEVALVEQILTDDLGQFSFVTPLPGTYRLRGERLGYRTSDSPNLHLMPGDSIALDLFMSMEAIVLDPITVRASARPWNDRYPLMGMGSFFDRQSRYGRSGLGSFLIRDSIARYEGRMDTSQMLLASVMQVRALNNQGGVILAHGCTPRYYLNGVEFVRGDAVHQSLMGAAPSTPLSQGIDPELIFPPDNLEGVEVYVSPTIPAEFNQGYPCGVVALWTRRAAAPDKAEFSWKRFFLGVGVLALGLLWSF